jgi:hypothetical protein
MTISDITDDIFARPPRSARRMPVISHERLVNRQACAVCGLRTDVLVCKECAEQPEVSRARVLTWLAGVDAQEAQAYAAWSQLCEAHLAFWEKLLAGRAKAADADTRACQAHPTYALLLDAEQTYERDQQALRVERARLRRALEALEGL